MFFVSRRWAAFLARDGLIFVGLCLFVLTEASAVLPPRSRTDVAAVAIYGFRIACAAAANLICAKPRTGPLIPTPYHRGTIFSLCFCPAANKRRSKPAYMQGSQERI